MAPAVGEMQTFQLYFEEPWKNPFGMVCIVGTKVEHEKTVIDKLTIIKPVFDINDNQRELFKGRLNSDGTGIIVTEPTIPGFLWQNPQDIQELIDAEEDEICDRSFQTYKTIRTDMKRNKDLLSHEVIYRFPKGVTCNNEFFNSMNRRSSHYELDTDMIIYKQVLGVDEQNNNIIQFCPCLVWKMAIDGEGKQTDDDDDALSRTSKAFAKLGIKVGTRGSSRMDD